jgi:poly(A) polymerase
MAARLGFAIDPPIEAAIAAHGTEIARSAPARLLEELYKLLRAGAGERAFHMLADRRLLEPIAPELQRGATEALWRSLAALDQYRRRFEDPPATLTNAILLGSLITPLGRAGSHRDPPPSLGILPLARRDIERLRQILALQARLRDMNASPRARRALMHRQSFADALAWLEIHGQAPDIVEHWRGFVEAADTYEADEGAAVRRPGRRRRRRRRGPRPPVPERRD